MKRVKIVGLLIILLGVGMLLWGAAAFSWQGPGLSEFMSEVGKYSFFFWLPTIIIGIALMSLSRKKKVRPQS